MDKRPVIFNLSRLLLRMYSPAPTGVDRLDIRYARYFLERADSRKVLYVHQFNNAVSLIPAASARLLVDSIWDRWMRHGDDSTRRPSVRENLAHGLAWARSIALATVGRGIDPALPGLRQGVAPPLYVNAGHTGIQYAPIHDQLRRTIGADNVFYLHDLIPIDYPEYVRIKAYADIHVDRVTSMAQSGSLVIANSDYTRERFYRFCDEHRLVPPPCEVIEIGVEEAFLAGAGQPEQPVPERLRSRLQGKPYFIMVSTIEPRKNHLLLLQIWRELARDLGDDCPTLVLIGKRGWENENIVDMIERCPSVHGNVIEFNDALDQEMVPIVRHAVAALYPSFEEGWGIPVTEALALGTPVICSDIAAHRECSQGRALFLHPLDGMGWMGAIKAMLGQGGVQEEALAMVSAFAPMTWDKHFERLDAVLDALQRPRA